MTLSNYSDFEGVCKNIDLSKYSTFIDIGGCLGTFACCIKKNFPNIEVSTFDLSSIEKFV